MEHREAGGFVFGEWVFLGVAAEGDDLAEALHFVDVIHPKAVDCAEVNEFFDFMERCFLWNAVGDLAMFREELFGDIAVEGWWVIEDQGEFFLGFFWFEVLEHFGEFAEEGFDFFADGFFH